MGTDVKCRKPKNLNINKFFEECVGVPIDAEIKGSWIHFHYGAWPYPHELNCEKFIKGFAKKNKVKYGKFH